MAKVRIKSEQITPFGGIFCVMEEFDALLSNIIDSTLDHVPRHSVINTVKSSVLSCACISVAAPVLKTYPHISCIIFPFILC